MTNVHPIAGDEALDDDGFFDPAKTASIEEMTERGFEHFILEGTDGQLSLDLGSEYSVRDSSLKIKVPTSIPVKGQFHEGQRIRLSFEVSIDSVHFDPIRDRHGSKLGLERKHIANVVGPIERADDR